MVMNKTNRLTLPAALIAAALLTAGSAADPSAQEIVDRTLESDPFGLSGAEISARMLLKDKSGSVRELSFVARSFRYDPPYAKSLVRFTAPADMAGAGFLQIQNREGDDDRHLFLPELKRARRIAGSLRATSFMGTDFSFADLDRRDFREGSAVKKPDDSFGKFPCYRVDVTPRRSDSPYSRIETWVRKDNLLPLKIQMYDRAKALHKTFTAQEVRRIDGQWFITKSRMLDHTQEHSTDLALDHVTPLKSASDDEFSVRNLERL